MRLGHPARVVIVFSALAVAFTWPLARHAGDSIPADLGDPLLSASILGWDADRLRHGLRGLWDAPIFYPYRHTLAFSEHLLGIAVFVAPIHWTTGNPLIAYNVAFLLSFVLAGLGMFLLARDLSGSDAGAWIAALIFAFSPVRFGQIGHLQMLMSGWMPLALWALHRFVSTASMLSLAAFVAFALVNCLSNNYFIYFLAWPAAIVAAHGLYWCLPASRSRILGGLAVAAGLVAIVLAPVASIYFQVQDEFGFRRTLSDATAFGADLATYLHGNEAVHPPLALWRHLPFVAKPIGAEGELFMGVAAFSLAAIAVALGCGRWRTSELRSARLYSAIVAVALLLSLGAHPTAWNVRLPIGGAYRLLFRLVPGFDGLRVPARMAVVVQLGVAVLAGIGVSVLLRSHRRPIRWALFGMFAAAIVLEGFAAPLPLAFVGPGGRTDRTAYDWVRERANGPILELPSGNLTSLFPPFGYEYQTLFHHQSIVTGSSGYTPALNGFIGGASSPLVEIPRFGEGLTMLRGLGVRTVIVHAKAYLSPALAAATLQALDSDPQTVERVAFPDIDIFRLAPFDDREHPDRGSGRDQRDITDRAVREIGREAFVATASDSPDGLPLAFDRDIDTRWVTRTPQAGGEFVELTFDRPYDIARVRILTSGRSVVNYPRHLVVESTNEAGATESVYAGPVVFQLGAGLMREPLRGPIDLWLRPNTSRRLRLLQTAGTRVMWAIDELSVWEYTRP